MLKKVEPCKLSDEDFEKLEIYISEYANFVKNILKEVEVVDFNEWNKANKIMDFKNWFVNTKGKEIPKQFSCFIKTSETVD